MRRLALAALVCLACGGSDAVQTKPQQVSATGCWLVTMTKSDGAVLCSGAMNLIEKDSALSGGWNCETPETNLGGYGGKLDGQRVGDDLFMDYSHEVSWGPWVVDVKVSADGKSLTGEVHAGETYTLTGTLDSL